MGGVSKLFRPEVARFFTDAPPDVVLRLAEAGLRRDAYRYGDPQLQPAVDARGLPWRVLAMDRGVERKLVSAKGCLFALIPDVVVDLVPWLARHQGDQTVHVAARLDGGRTEVLHRERSIDAAPMRDHAAQSLWRIQDELHQAGHTVSTPEFIPRRDVPSDWPLELRTLVALSKEATRGRKRSRRQ